MNTKTQNRRVFLKKAAALLQALPVSDISIPALLTANNLSFAQSSSGALVWSMIGSAATANNMPSSIYSFCKLPSGAFLPNGSTPIIQCCDITYFPCHDAAFKYLKILGYDSTGAIVTNTTIPFSDAVKSISPAPSTNGSQMIFTGFSGISTAVNFIDIGLPDKFNVSVDDVNYISNLCNLDLSIAEAKALVSALSGLCCGSIMVGPSSISKRSAVGMTTGGFIGGVIGMIFGAMMGGPPGAAAGFAVGAASGANVGAALSNREYYEIPTSTELNKAIIKVRNLRGPFAKSSLIEDLITYNYPQYGSTLIPYAGALAMTSNGTASVYYPLKGAISPPVTNVAPYITASGRTIYKYIFVIVESKGFYEMRIHPDDFYPDAVTAAARINHSQLTEGSRIFALFGTTDQQVWGAGQLYIENGTIIGIDSRSGHYFRSFIGQDAVVISNAINCLNYLGYNTNNLVCSNQEDCGNWLSIIPDAY